MPNKDQLHAGADEAAKNVRDMRSAPPNIVRFEAPKDLDPLQSFKSEKRTLAIAAIGPECIGAGSLVPPWWSGWPGEPLPCIWATPRWASQAQASRRSPVM